MAKLETIFCAVTWGLMNALRSGWPSYPQRPSIARRQCKLPSSLAMRPHGRPDQPSECEQ